MESKVKVRLFIILEVVLAIAIAALVFLLIANYKRNEKFKETDEYKEIVILKEQKKNMLGKISEESSNACKVLDDKKDEIPTGCLFCIKNCVGLCAKISKIAVTKIVDNKISELESRKQSLGDFIIKDMFACKNTSKNMNNIV